MKEFSGKVALVTGTTGVGRAIALRFAAGGAQVVACGIEPAGNQALADDAQKLGLTVLVESGDVTELETVRSIVAKTVDRFGGVDIIVNAAAIHPFGTVVETDLATWNRCMMVNVGSIYLLAHVGVPEMKKRGGGSIINLASVQGYACQRGVAAYATSKGAIHSLTPREFDQPGFGAHTHAGAIGGALRAGSVGGRGVRTFWCGASAGAHWHAGRSCGVGCVSGIG
jgi:meso-butanediol dehydrogenase / (S,S)-butanediol dehydrogenase / diacetyl reductase